MFLCQFTVNPSSFMCILFYIQTKIQHKHFCKPIFIKSHNALFLVQRCTVLEVKTFRHVAPLATPISDLAQKYIFYDIGTWFQPQVFKICKASEGENNTNDSESTINLYFLSKLRIIIFYYYQTMRTHTYSCTSITRVIYTTMPYTFLDKTGKPTDLNKQKKALVVLTPGGHQGVSINKDFLYFTPSTRNWRFWRSGSAPLGWQHTGVSSPLVLLWSRGQDSFWRCTCGKN